MNDSGAAFLQVTELDAIKEAALAFLDGSLRHFPTREDEISGLRSGLMDQSFNLLILGEYKRGKSSIANILMGQAVLPTGVTPLTSIPTVVEYGFSFSARAGFLDGRTLELDPDQLVDFVSEEANPKNRLGVTEIHIRVPSPFLQKGVRLIDTPGIGSIHEHNTEVALAQLSRCDAALLVLSVDQPLTRIEADFLSKIRAYSSRIIIVLNKVDYLDEPELVKSLEYVRTNLEGLLGGSVHLFPFSAKPAMAIDPRVAMNNPLFEALEKTLISQKRALILEGFTRRFRDVIGRCRFEVELGMAALGFSEEDLMSRYETYRLRGTRLHGEQKTVLLNFEKDLTALTKELSGPAFDGWYKDQLEEIREAFFLHLPEGVGDSPGHLKIQLETQLQAEIAGRIQLLEKLSSDYLREPMAKAISCLNTQVMCFSEQLQQIAAEIYELKRPDANTFPVEGVRLLLESVYPDEPCVLEVLADMTLPDWPGSWIARFPSIHAAWVTFERNRVIRRSYKRIDDLFELAVGQFRQSLIRNIRSRVGEIIKNVEQDFVRLGDDFESGMKSAIERAKRSRQNRDELEAAYMERLEFLDEGRRYLDSHPFRV